MTLHSHLHREQHPASCRDVCGMLWLCRHCYLDAARWLVAVNTVPRAALPCATCSPESLGWCFWQLCKTKRRSSPGQAGMRESSCHEVKAPADLLTVLCPPDLQHGLILLSQQNPGLHQKRGDSREREGIVPLYPALLRLHL